MTTTLNRRNMLRGMAIGTAVATTVTGTAASAAVEPAAIADHQIAALLSDLEKAIADRSAAIEAKEWKVAEYAHLWPLAAEEILGGANAWSFGGSRPSAETNLAGEPIYRRAGDLTKRLSRQFRTGDDAERMVNFSVERSEDLSSRLASVRSRRGKTEKQQKHFARRATALETAIPLAEEYEAVTARLRKVSGIADILAARKDAEVRIEKMLKTLSQTKARTLHGATMKARAIAMWQASCGSGDKVVDSIRTMGVAQSVAADLVATSATA